MKLLHFVFVGYFVYLNSIIKSVGIKLQDGVNLWLQFCLDLDVMWLLRGAPSTIPAVHMLHLVDVEEWFNAAAQIHDGEHADADLAAECHKWVVWHKGHKNHRWQVIDHNDCQDNQHHLQGCLLYWVQRFLSCHWTSKDPDDRDDAENHDCKGKEDDATEDLIDTHDSHHALGEAIN